MMSFRMKFFLICITCLCAFAHCGNKTEDKQLSDSEILEFLLETYDARLSPYSYDKNPVIVSVSIYTHEIYHIDEVNMEFTATIFFRRSWRDPRLQYSDMTNTSKLTISSSVYQKLWVPDIYFPDSRETLYHQHTIPNAFIHLFPDGTVFVSSRYSIILACPMDLSLYLLDTQRCRIGFEIYGHSDDRVKLVWVKHDPVEFKNSLQLPTFRFDHFDIEDCSPRYSTGTFSCLAVVLVLKRELASYMLVTFIPSLVIVMASWVGFWIDFTCIPGRIGLCITTLLTMGTQVFVTISNEPNVSYIKAMNVWMGGCLLSVFLALVEFAVAHSVYRATLCKTTSGIQSNEKLAHDRANRIDCLARMAFPTAFFVFIAGFWINYSILAVNSGSNVS